MTQPRSVRKQLGSLRRLVASLSAAELAEAMRVVAESRASREQRLARVSSAVSGRIVFVCYGNIMRSAFAAAYLQQRDANLASRISSAGTHSTAGRPAEPDALRVAGELSVDLSSHRATPLGDVRPTSGDVFVCMDLANAARTRRAPGVDPNRVFLIGDVLDHARMDDRIVHDPYGQGAEATRRAFARVRLACDAWSRLLSR